MLAGIGTGLLLAAGGTLLAGWAGVPLVAAFHVTRYVGVMVLTGVLFRWERARLHAAGRGSGGSGPGA